jgi:hypothetical protein
MSTRIKTRTRINMSRTQKDGWVPEITVETEWDGVGGGEEDEEGLYRMGTLTQEVQKIAYKQADDQNRMEGRDSVWSKANPETYLRTDGQ